MRARSFFVFLLLLNLALAAPASPECRHGAAQPSLRALVTKLGLAFEEKDAAAMANLASCPFLVGQPGSDNLSHVPPAVFARRFLRAVKVLDLTLNEGDVVSTYPGEPRRILLWTGEKRWATLYVDRQPRADFQHRHIFSFERDANGWRFKGYATHDGGLLELLRRGYTNVLV